MAERGAAVGGALGDPIGGSALEEAIGEENFETVFDPLDLTGSRGRRAAERAASAQRKAAELGIAEQRAARLQAREDLSPFRLEGEAALSGLSSLITDPEARRDFVTKNQFFQSLTGGARSSAIANQAVGGGTAGTGEALQDSLLAMGTELIGKNIKQRFNIAALGANAAAGQATATLGTGRSISDLQTQAGNAQAAGIIGAQNAQTQGRQTAASVGIGIAAIFASDRRIKENIEQIGHLDNGLPVYMFNYIGDPKMQMSVIAQDVQEVMPDAVIEIDGVLHVNMEKVSNAY